MAGTVAAFLPLPMQNIWIDLKAMEAGLPATPVQ